MDKEKNMECKELRYLLEENAILREQKAILSCILAFVTIGWIKEKIIRLQKERKNNKEGE